MLVNLDLPLGRRLKVIRVSRNLLQRDVAISAGLSPSTLSLIEGGYKVPADFEIDGILRVLGLSRKDIGFGEVEE